MLTQEELKRILHYDPASGRWAWRVSRGRVIIGEEAGCTDTNGRRRICIDGTLYLAARLAWLYMTGSWPEAQIDHKDTDQTNDRWNNLRPATHAQNLHNTTGWKKGNAAGYKGVIWHSSGKRWEARIMHNRVTYRLGLFETAEEAHAAYQVKAKELHGEYANF